MIALVLLNIIEFYLTSWGKEIKCEAVSSILSYFDNQVK